MITVNRLSFTLVEFVSILVILALVTIFSVAKYVNLKAESAETICQSNVAVITGEFLYHKVLNPDCTMTDYLATEYTANESLHQRFTCPLNGTYQTDGVTIFCTVHKDSNTDDNSLPNDDEPDLSDYPQWVKQDEDGNNNAYDQAGTYVQYDGKLYYNHYWTQATPGTSSEWQEVTDDWVSLNTYADAGTIVEYEGKKYKNKWWVSPNSGTPEENNVWEEVTD